MNKTPLCPQCKVGHFIYDKNLKIMICSNCGYKTGADIDDRGNIKNKDVEKDNLRMGKKFELGSFA